MRTAAFAALAVLLLAAPPALALHGPYDELFCLSDEGGLYRLCLHAWDAVLFQTCWGVDVRAAGVSHQQTACTPFVHICQFGCPIRIEDLPIP